MKSKSIIDVATKTKVVEYSKQMNSWKRAAKKFGFSPKVVAHWGKKAGLKLKSKSYSDLSDEAKDEIVKFGVKHNSWNQAAHKFGVPTHAVAFWGKKAGCKLKSRYPDGYKETVVSFGEGGSWKAASDKFGVSKGTIGVWAKQMGKEKKSFTWETS
jgi:transposase